MLGLSRRGRGGRIEPPRRFIEYWKAQEGEFALPGVGLGGRAGARGARRPPRPGRRPALRPRRPGAPARRLGHLLPHGPHRDRGHRRRAPGAPRPSPSSTRTVPTTPRTRPSRVSPSSSPPGWPPPSAASGPQRRLGDDPGGRHRRPHPRQLPGLRLGRSKRLRDRRLRATASRCSPSAAWPPTTSSTEVGPRRVPPLPLRERRHPHRLGGPVPLDLVRRGGVWSSVSHVTSG